MQARAFLPNNMRQKESFLCKAERTPGGFERSSYCSAREDALFIFLEVQRLEVQFKDNGANF